MHNRDRNRHGNPWDSAPAWARELAEMQLQVMWQNEAILALLEKRASQLSPEDQANVNAIFQVAGDIKRKIDTAQSE